MAKIHCSSVCSPHTKVGSQALSSSGREEENKEIQTTAFDPLLLRVLVRKKLRSQKHLKTARRTKRRTVDGPLEQRRKKAPETYAGKASSSHHQKDPPLWVTSSLQSMKLWDSTRSPCQRKLLDTRDQINHVTSFPVHSLARIH